jgi:hypothetical protein
VSLLLGDVGDADHQQLITRAKELLSMRPTDVSVLSNPAYFDAKNPSETPETTQPRQPEGPVPPPNPLLSNYEAEGIMVRVEGEGMIEPAGNEGKSDDEEKD